ncbi:hypothetical protein [Iningainema tapete]|uniref:Uncharacterized protein n=1 Tax=Iningainema tapete BLCC-T55 TaxID=2748662 RepID=A0A8J6XGP2_9CYAN|nr:hypothetical protein [Iningainema tapete]MBD2772855.1 hypothetical protein [Iningainema tapete BLCC-T55]
MVGLEPETKPCPLVAQEGTPLSPTLGASPNPAISFITLPDATWYEGQIINGKPNGLGVAA